MYEGARPDGAMREPVTVHGVEFRERLICGGSGLRYSRPATIFPNPISLASSQGSTVNLDFLYGILGLSFWGYVLVTS